MRHTPGVSSLRALFVLAALTGCAQNPPSLRVDVRSDYVPGVEIAEVVVIRSTPEGDLSQRYTARASEDWVRGVRAATFEDIETGPQTLRGMLIAPGGEVLASRRVEARVGGTTVVTLVFTRSCAGVECPSASGLAATECLGGTCVPPDCTPETPASCPTQCTGDDECERPTATCARATCRAGTCFVQDDGVCAPSEYCHPELGCEARDVDAGRDAMADDDAGDAGTDAELEVGVPDADGGPGDIGPGDIGPGDIGPGDIGPGDIGPGDTGPVDAGPRDTGPADAGPACTATTNVGSVGALTSRAPGIYGRHSHDAARPTSGELRATAALTVRTSDFPRPIDCGGSCDGVRFSIRESVAGISMGSGQVTIASGTRFRMRFELATVLTESAYVVFEAACVTDCTSGSARCSEDLGCYPRGSEYCRACENRPADRCACITPTETNQPNGTDCFYVDGSTFEVGTCMDGFCR